VPFDISFINSHKKIYLAAIFLFFAAAALLLSQIKLREDISEMLPSVLKEELRLFQNSPLSGKTFVVVKSPQEEETLESADIISHAFIEDGGLGLSTLKTDGDFILAYYYFAPRLWNKEFAEKIENLAEPEAVRAKMEENYKVLLSPAGTFMKEFITADPLGMIPVFAKELKNLNLGSSLETKNGYISSPDGKKILLIFDSPENSLDGAHAKKINEAFKTIKKEIPESSEAFLMGAVRYTNENSEIIANDIKRILPISSFFMLALFLIFLRTKKALLIYIVPAAVMSVAAVAVFFWFGGISGITIGFGSVLMGLSIDYSAYMYFALKSSKEQDRFLTARKMVKPITVSAVTSIIVFSLLFFSSISLFRQISLFSAAGLAAALFLALFVAPFIFDCGGDGACTRAYKSGESTAKTKAEESVIPENTDRKSDAAGLPSFSPAAAAVIIAIIFAAAAVSFKFVDFNASLDSVNTVSKQFEYDRAEFENLTGGAHSGSGFFFVFGDTVEETLQNNERVSSQNENILQLAGLYPSQKTSGENLAEWKKFWDAQKIEKIKKEIEDFSKLKNLKPEIFNPFYEFLKTGESAAEGSQISLNDIYNPLIKHNDGFAFVNIVPENAVITETEGIKTFFISNAVLQKKIASNIKGNIAAVTAILIISVFFILILWLKKVQFALAALAAPLCGIGVFLVAAAVFGIEVNLFGLFAVPLLIGLGIDYGIFIIYRQKGETKLHPTKAVIVAAVSTIIGFGSLMAAGHKVLFMIGFMVFTGILTAIIISVFVLPSLLKGVKKTLPLLLLICLMPFAGCATVGVKYNVKEPPLLSVDNADTAMFYGSYMDDFNFRAISRTEPDGYRIVIMSDLGIKMQDMKIKKNEDTDIYFYIEYMPKEVVENFAAFFKEYYFFEEKPNIRKDAATIYYFKNQHAIVWVKKI